jgi:lipopolysaccharide transport system permease protein
MSLAVLLAALLLTHGMVPWTIILFPLLLLPFACATVGTAWFLSSLGVYIRDIAQTTGILTTTLLFVSPVFFPLSAVPTELQAWMKLNPLTFVIESAREVLIFGEAFDWVAWGWYLIASLGTAWGGFWWFQRTRKGFADVI